MYQNLIRCPYDPWCEEIWRCSEKSSKVLVPWPYFLYNKGTCNTKKQVSMISKPRHREEEPQNTDCHKTSERQLKQSNQLFLPHQDDCKGYFKINWSFEWISEEQVDIHLSSEVTQIQLSFQGHYGMDQTTYETCHMAILHKVRKTTKF